VRIDQLLHWLCLEKSRSLATRACREGRVRLGGHPVKASHEAHVGDRIALQAELREGALDLELIELPPGQVSRPEAHRYYRVVSSGGSRDAP
jgi:ribosome-associated heat shock protein Hsp15